MLAGIQQKLQSLQDNIADSKRTNAEYASKLKASKVRPPPALHAPPPTATGCRLIEAAAARPPHGQERKARVLAEAEQVALKEEALDKSINEEATQVSALEWESRAHKNAVKARKQKIVNLRNLDAKDLAQTTAERKAVRTLADPLFVHACRSVPLRRARQVQAKLDAANIQLIKSIPGLSGIVSDESEEEGDGCVGDEETQELQGQNESLVEQLASKRKAYESASAEKKQKLMASQSAGEQLAADCAAAADALEATKKTHAAHTQYINSTEASIRDIERDMDSDAFTAREAELDAQRARKEARHARCRLHCTQPLSSLRVRYR
jgi:hypothetical protein